MVKSCKRNKNDTKVFCSECIYRADNSAGNCKESLKKKEVIRGDDWWQRGGRKEMVYVHCPISCMERNRDNDCKYYIKLN